MITHRVRFVLLERAGMAALERFDRHCRIKAQQRLKFHRAVAAVVLNEGLVLALRARNWLGQSLRSGTAHNQTAVPWQRE